MGGNRLIPRTSSHPFTKRDHLDEWIEKNIAHCRDQKTRCEGVGVCKCSCKQCVDARSKEERNE
jgi:GTP cyclohydrolase I